MSIVRVTKEFSFEAAHALWNYNGKCKNLHGHSYKLSVTVKGKVKDNPNDPKTGMLIDFGDLKKIVTDSIVDVFDHAVIINKSASYGKFKESLEIFDRLIITDYQPTCENMVVDFADRISRKLEPEVKLYSVKLHETANSYGEWYAEDN